MSREVIDLFAGVGWDVAARELGLDPLGIEWDVDACATRKALGMRTVQADVSALDPLDFAPIWGEIASPPCPTWSSAGKGAGTRDVVHCIQAAQDLASGRDTREQHRRACEDERSILVVEPLRWALALKPEWIALEQVPPVLDYWRLTARLLEQHGWRCWTGVLEAERYGVPQTRERAILMASRSSQPHPPKATHQRFVSGEPARHEITLEGEILPWVSMAEALGWGMAERPSVTVAAGSGRQGGPAPLDGGSGSRAVIEREREPGSTVQRYQRGAGMTERHGERVARSLGEPSFTIQAGNQGSGTRLRWER